MCNSGERSPCTVQHLFLAMILSFSIRFYWKRAGIYIQSTARVNLVLRKISFEEKQHHFLYSGGGTICEQI